jgi:hypothetical protein
MMVRRRLINGCPLSFVHLLAGCGTNCCLIARTADFAR